MYVQFRLTMAILVASAFTALNARAQDQCRDAFLKDLGSKQVVSENQNAVLAQKHARCVRSQSSSTGGSNTQVGGSYGPIQASGGQTSSSTSDTSASDCGNESDDQQLSASIYYAQQAYHDVVDAWKTCMTQRQYLACWAEPSGSADHVTVHIDWHILGNAPQVAASSLSIGSHPTTDLYPQGTKLLSGENFRIVDRKGDEDVTVNFQATSGSGVGNTCSVWVPPHESVIPPAPPREVNMSWEQQLPVAQMPQQGTCSCISVNFPLKDMSHWTPGSPSPTYSDGALGKVINNCGRDVEVYEVGDTKDASPPVPLQVPAEGRRFGYQTLHDGQTLVVNIGGLLTVAPAYGSCPAASFTPFFQPPRPPGNGQPYVPNNGKP